MIFNRTNTKLLITATTVIILNVFFGFYLYDILTFILMFLIPTVFLFDFDKKNVVLSVLFTVLTFAQLIFFILGFPADGYKLLTTVFFLPPLIVFAFQTYKKKYTKTIHILNLIMIFLITLIPILEIMITNSIQSLETYFVYILFLLTLIFYIDPAIEKNEKESIGIKILLCFVTFGIYTYAWIYQLILKHNELSENKLNSVSTLLLSIFVPFYLVFFIYQTANNLYRYQISNDFKVDNKSTLLLVLTLFGFGLISIAILEDSYRHILTNSY